MVSLGGGQVVSLAKLQEIFHHGGEFDGNHDDNANMKSSEEPNQDGNSEEADPTFQVPVVVNNAKLGATTIPVPARHTTIPVPARHTTIPVPARRTTVPVPAR